MYQFIETIRIEKGNACNLFYHNRRLNEVRRYFRPECAPLQLEDYLHLSADMNGVKCRVVYTEEGITEVSYSLYEMRPVRSPYGVFGYYRLFFQEHRQKKVE